MVETSCMYHYMTACVNVLCDHNDTGGFVQYMKGDRTPAGSPQRVQMISVCRCAFSMRPALCRWAAAISKYIIHVSST